MRGRHSTGPQKFGTRPVRPERSRGARAPAARFLDFAGVDRVPRAAVLAAGGLEPQGRMGLLADLAAIQNAGVSGLGVATAVTAQGGATFAIHGMSPSILRAQITVVREAARISAVKLGVVPNAAALRAITGALAGLDAFWVVDPVTRTSRGRTLSHLSPSDYLGLAAGNVILTPNAQEASWLLGTKRIRRKEEAALLGWALALRGFGAVVVKGGHLPEGPADVVCFPDRICYLEGSRLRRSPMHRGTGCRFASTLAASLALGMDLVESARRAKQAVEEYLSRSPP